jgi:hypothetical protein
MDEIIKDYLFLQHIYTGKPLDNLASLHNCDPTTNDLQAFGLSLYILQETLQPISP